MNDQATKGAARKDTAKSQKLYRIADNTWSIAAWLWSAVIIVFVLSFAAGLAVAQDLNNNFNKIVLTWLSTPNPVLMQEIYRKLTLSALMFFIAISVLSLILRQRLKPPATNEMQELLALVKKDVTAAGERDMAQKTKDDAQQAKNEEGFKQYLRFIKEMNRRSNFGGLAQYWQRLAISDVPLQATYMHLRVIADRPIYDLPGEQQRQLREVQQQTELDSVEREDYMRRLHFSWYSYFRSEKPQMPQTTSIVDILGAFSGNNHVAIILGTPGSGKTTFLRWVAYYLADTLLSAHATSSATESVSTQIPIFIQMNKYVESLAKETITLRQFIITQLSEAHPNAAVRVLDALEHGHCLVMFDGIDEGFASPVSRHVAEAIYSFIMDYAEVDPQTQQRNYFIVTSRIADYRPEIFAEYTHYTLLDLGAQQVEHFLAKWCSAIEQHFVVSTLRHSLTEQRRIEASSKGREQLYDILKTHRELQDLAVSPLVLVLMAFMQMSGRDVWHHRFALYQAVTSTLLITWNRESGRKINTREELVLIEEVLSRFAERMLRYHGVLSRYEVDMITRQTMAEQYHTPVYTIKENDVAEFVEMLRRSSGLFAEVGDGLFCFANQGLLEYYAALYLIRSPREERRQLAIQYYPSNKWSEPLQLMFMYKSQQQSREEQKEIDELLLTILNSPVNHNSPAQSNVHFVVRSIVDGGLQVTDKALIAQIRSSTRRIGEQRSGQITQEQQQSVNVLLQRLDKQDADEITPTQPLRPLFDR